MLLGARPAMGGREELTTRLLAAEAGIDQQKLRTGAVAEAAETLSTLPLMIDDNPPETIGGIRSLARRLARRGALGFVAVDYLQLVAGDPQAAKEGSTAEVSSISRGLKRLAGELDIPVLSLTQLNRALESRPDKRPQMSDLRQSGSLENISEGTEQRRNPLFMFDWASEQYRVVVRPTSRVTRQLQRYGVNYDQLPPA